MGDRLEDLKSRDVDNFMSLQLDRYLDKSRSVLVAMQGQMLRMALRKCTGVDIEETMSKFQANGLTAEHAGQEWQEILAVNGVVIESKANAEDDTRNGTYLYKNGEIVLFMGQIYVNDIARRYEFYSNGSLY